MWLPPLPPRARELLSNKHPFTKTAPIFAQQLEEETEEPLGSRILVGYDNAHEDQAGQEGGGRGGGGDGGYGWGRRREVKGGGGGGGGGLQIEGWIGGG